MGTSASHKRAQAAWERETKEAARLVTRPIVRALVKDRLLGRTFIVRAVKGQPHALEVELPNGEVYLVSLAAARQPHLAKGR